MFIWNYLKNRKILICTMGYFSGILAVVFSIANTKIHHSLSLYCLVVSVAVIFLLNKKIIISLALLAFLSGVFIMGGELDRALDDKDLPVGVNRSYKIAIDNVIRSLEADEKYEGKLLGFWDGEEYQEYPLRVRITGISGMEPGEVIKAYGIILMPKQARNKGTFNERRYLFGRGITRIIQITGRVERNYDKRHEFTYYIYVVKESMSNLLNRYLPESHAALTKSFLFGDTTGIEKETKQQFSTSGLSHLMAVSGFNVGIIVFAAALIRRIFGWRYNTGNVISLFILVCFCLLTGFGCSILRAALIAAVYRVGVILRRRDDPGTSLAFSAGIILLLNPFAIFDLGFVLSYSAYIGILLFNEPLYNLFKKIFHLKFAAAILSLSIAAQAAVLPVVINNFYFVSLIALAGNFYISPLLVFVIFLGIFIILFGSVNLSFVAWFFSLFLKKLVDWIEVFTAWSAEQSSMIVNGTAVSMRTVICYYTLLILVFFNKRFLFKKKKSAPVIMCVLLVFSLFRGTGNELRITMIDVGQGDCVLIQKGGYNVLIDGGTGGIDVAECLPGLNVRRLDIVVVTHSDNDHMGGIIELVKSFRVDRLYVNGIEEDEAFAELYTSYGRMPERLSEGDSIVLGKDCSMDILNPVGKNSGGNGETDDNDSSVVVLLTDNGFKGLFMGDAGEGVEKRLINAVQGEVSLLKVGHHGSKTSSSEAFIEAIKPETAIIGVGKNMYGHPNGEVISRLKRYGADIYRTDTDGAVTFRYLKGEVKIIKMFDGLI